MGKDTKSDTVIMPRSLTAENGAKYLLNGEFKESVILSCDSCHGSGEFEDGELCEVCGGAGDYRLSVTVSWITIKEIYAKVVKHLSIEGSHSQTPDAVRCEKCKCRAFNVAYSSYSTVMTCVNCDYQSSIDYR